MPKTRHSFPKCGHRGHGDVCHRCSQATNIEAQTLNMPDGEKKQLLLAEVARLRSSTGTPALTITEN